MDKAARDAARKRATKARVEVVVPPGLPNDLRRALDALDRVEALVEECRAFLKRFEFPQEWAGDPGTCPVCGRNPFRGHADDCDLDTLRRALDGK